MVEVKYRWRCTHNATGGISVGIVKGIFLSLKHAVCLMAAWNGQNGGNLHYGPVPNSTPCEEEIDHRNNRPELA